MDDASGLIQDSSGNSRHATTSAGSPTYLQPSPIVSDPEAKSILFPLSAQFSVPDSGFDFGNTFSLEAWQRKTSIGGFQILYDKGVGAYALYETNTNKMTLDKNGGTVIVEEAGTTTDMTNFHHWVVTKNAATSAVLYKDAVDVSSNYADAVLVDTAGALFIGRNAASFGDGAGYLAELAVYPTVLSAARVQAHYTAAFALGGSVAWISA